MVAVGQGTGEACGCAGEGQRQWLKDVSCECGSFLVAKKKKWACPGVMVCFFVFFWFYFFSLQS